jgi:hypothetical protein
VVVASESITPQQVHQMSALRDAVVLAGTVRDNLSATDPARVGAAAADAAGRLVRALIDSDADPALVDSAQVLASTLERGDGGPSLRDASQTVSLLESQITTLWRGRLSELVLRRLKARSEMPSTIAGEIDSQNVISLKELGLDPLAPEISTQLQSCVEASKAMLASLKPVDYVAVARQWASGAAAPPGARMLSERLSAAAQARHQPDLELAARAARAIESQTASPPSEREQYVQAMPALLAVPADQTSLEHARSSMRAWAGASPPVAESQVADIKQQSPTASQQRADLRREEALATIRRVQEILAQMPQQLGKAEQAAAWSRQTQRRVKQAERDLTATPSARQPAARRALNAAQAQARDAAQALSEIGKNIDPEEMWKLAQELDAHAPQEQSPAIVPVQRELAPALESLHDAIEAQDPDGAELAAGNARQAIVAVQGGLRRARQALLERDPLVAAREFDDLLAGNNAGAAEVALDPGGDSPGYEPALRAYFKAIQQSASKPEAKP